MVQQGVSLQKSIGEKRLRNRFNRCFAC